MKKFARDYLVGTEIMTDSPMDLTLQILLNYQELSIQSALRRMAIIAASMHREAIGCLRGLDYLAARANREFTPNADLHVDWKPKTCEQTRYSTKNVHP